MIHDEPIACCTSQIALHLPNSCHMICRYRSKKAKIVLVPHYNLECGGFDDGVRMVSSADELAKFQEVFCKLLSDLKLEFHVMTSSKKDDRVKQLSRLAYLAA
jgi:hypothetical protein